MTLCRARFARFKIICNFVKGHEANAIVATDVLNQAFKEYVGKQMKQKDKPSIMEKLTHFKEVVAKGKNRERAKEH